VPDLDLLIIGSGSGNTILTDDFADWTVGIVEQGRFGGTCLNVGCIPSKMLVLPADRIVEAAESARLGVHFAPPVVDWPAIRDRVFGRIDPIAESGRTFRREQPGVALFEGPAKFTDRNTVIVDGEEITAREVVIATGARPMLPEIDGLAESSVHTSDTIMRIDSIPEHLVIVGGGYIAAEMGHVFSALGSRVSIVHRGARLLTAEDHDVSDRFTESFRRRAQLHLNSQVTSIRRASETTDVRFNRVDSSGRSSPASLSADAVLVCTGRLPNTDRLGLEHTSVELTPDGRIETDDELRTAQAGIWAIGDVRSALQLKHVANHEARVVRHNLLHPESPRRIDERHVPHAVFAEPQIGAVGLREIDLIAAQIPYRTGRRDYSGTAYGWALGDEVGFAKVLIHSATEQVLGAHIIGVQAATLVQQITTAMQFEIPAGRLARDQLWCHPALTEVVENALLDALE